MLRFHFLEILLISLILLSLSFCDEKIHVEGEVSEEQLKEQRVEKLASLPFSHPPPDPGKARLLLYDYDIEATTVIHKPSEPEESGIKVSTKAKYFFEILNHDQDGCILARYQVHECIHGPCKNLPDIYFYIVQGGQNILGVYYKPQNGSENDQINWGLMLSLVYAIASPAKGGAGDEQIVKTPFGYCRHFFAKPEDKLFTRKFDLCDFESTRNHTFVPSLVSLDYQQFIEYKQNKKIDADIVFIEADEQFLVQTPFNPNSTIRVHSHVSAEMMNRTRRFMKRYCPKGMMGHVCALDIFEAKYLGKNWLDISKKLNDRSPAQITLEEFVAEKHTELQKCTKSEECPGLFNSLTEVTRRSEPEVIMKVLKNKKNDEILTFLLDAIAAGGPTAVWKNAFEHVQKSRRHLAQEFLDNIAFTTVPPTVALKEFKTWKINPDLDPHNTIGYLTSRRCLSTPSHLNACINQKDSFFNYLFENKEKTMTVEQQSKGLWHLHFKSTSDYFSQFLCSYSNDVLQERALTFYNKLHHSFFERKINMNLLKIFWNTCPQPVPQSHSVLALNVLIKIAPHYPTVGSFLLRNTSIPVTVKGMVVANNDGSLEELNIALSSEVPLFSIRSGKTHGTLTTLGFPKLISTSKVSQSIMLRDYSQKIRLLSGHTLDLSMNAVVTVKLDSDEATFNVNSGLSVETKATISDSHQDYGTVESKTEMFTKINIENIHFCPVVDMKEIFVVENYSKQLIDRETDKKTSKTRHPGSSINLGPHVNSQCRL